MSNTCITAAEESGLTIYEAETCNGDFKCPNCPYRKENIIKSKAYREEESEREYRGG